MTSNVKIPSDEKLRGWVRNCDPQRPIDHPDDPFYVPFDGDSSLRGSDHIAGLYDTIALSEAHSCQLFSGFSGTGKSTELWRLTHLLEEKGFVVLLVNSSDYHDLNHALTIEDLMVIVAGSFAEATDRALGRASTTATASYWDRFQAFLDREVQLDIKIPTGVADLRLGIKHAKEFWLKVREALASSPSRLKAHCHSEIQRHVAELTKAKRPTRGVVFIFDNLEKLSSDLFKFREVMASIVQVLTDYPDFLRLPDCHVIYTIPPYVQLVQPNLKAQYDRTSLVLPAVKVLEPGEDHEPFGPGVAALRDLVSKRIDLDEVFGDRLDLLDQLIRYSGGHIRTLITFVRDLVYDARRQGLPTTDAAIERVVQPFREQAGLSIWRESVPLLERILNTGSLEGLAHDEYPYLAHLMDNYVVLCYRNGDGWYEVHPLVRDTVRRLAEDHTADRSELDTR